MSDAKKLTAKIKATRAKISKLTEQLIGDTNLLFQALSKELFEIYPKLENFAWAQYTPWFNDGDTCEFSAKRDRIFINGSDEPYDFYDSEPITDPNESWKTEALESICGLLYGFTNDELLAMFADHSKIIVTKDSIVYEGYNHG